MLPQSVRHVIQFYFVYFILLEGGIPCFSYMISFRMSARTKVIALRSFATSWWMT